MEFERDRSIGLGPTVGDGHTDRHRHTDIFLKHILDCGSDVESKIIKKIEVDFFTIPILPSLLMSLESKNYVRQHFEN